MSIVQTVLIFVCIPAAIISVFVLAVFGTSSNRQQVRYRPGRPWNFQPVWYVPHPDIEGPVSPPLARTALIAPSTAAIEGTPAHKLVPAGGASGEW